MKKYIILAAACIMLLAACNKEKEKEKENNQTNNQSNNTATINTPQPVTIDWKEDDVIAVAYLGQFNDFESMTNTMAYQQYCLLYPQLKGIKNFAAKQTGNDTYLIITRDTQTDITITGHDSFSNNTEILYKNEDGETGNNTTAFLICGHINNEKPSITITGVNNGNTIVDYTPTFNNQQRIQLPNNGGVNDITNYHNNVARFNHNDTYNEIIRTEITPYGAVNVSVDNNKISQIWPNLTIQSKYNINNLNGIATGVAVADIESDFNPVIAIRMADGTVRTIALHDLLAYSNSCANTTNELDGQPLTDIVDFVYNGSDNTKGTDIDYSTITIYAIDSKGGRHEINNSPYNRYYYCKIENTSEDANEDNEVLVELALMQNYTILLQVYDMGSLYFRGTYQPVNNQYTLPKQFTFEGYDAFQTEVSGSQTRPAKGTFTINDNQTMTLHLGEPYNIDYQLQQVP